MKSWVLIPKFKVPPYSIPKSGIIAYVKDAKMIGNIIWIIFIERKGNSKEFKEFIGLFKRKKKAIKHKKSKNR